MNSVGARLKVLRAALGNPSQGEIAAAAGVSVRSYNSWESDRGRPSYKSAQALATVFNATADWILFGAERAEDERLRGIEVKLDEILSILRGGEPR